MHMCVDGKVIEKSVVLCRFKPVIVSRLQRHHRPIVSPISVPDFRSPTPRVITIHGCSCVNIIPCCTLVLTHIDRCHGSIHLEKCAYLFENKAYGRCDVHECDGEKIVNLCTILPTGCPVAKENPSVSRDVL